MERIYTMRQHINELILFIEKNEVGQLCPTPSVT